MEAAYGNTGGANPLAGEVVLTLDGRPHRCKLTLGALAALEAGLPDHSLTALVARLEGGSVSARDIMAVLVAGLRGGGWQGDEDSLVTSEITGGLEAAGLAAGRLIALAFAPQMAGKGGGNAPQRVSSDAAAHIAPKPAPSPRDHAHG